MEKYFLTQIKRTNGTVEKGCVVKDTLDAAKQSYYAYLGAYGFGHDANTDYVQCLVTNVDGLVLMADTWKEFSEEPEPIVEQTNA